MGSNNPFMVGLGGGSVEPPQQKDEFIDIYLTDLETSDRLRFPMLPEEISVHNGVIFQTYTILGIGDIRLPAGGELTGISWEGILPGEKRQLAQHPYIKEWPYVTEWQSPQDIKKQLDVWRTGKKKLRLLVTQTPINNDVYIQWEDGKYKGGYGDYHYNISFLQAKDLKVYAGGASGSGAATATTAENRPLGQERPSPPTATTHTVVAGDTLYKIAEKEMGDGGKYTELLEANKGLIGDDPNQLRLGQILSIPNQIRVPSQILSIANKVKVPSQITSIANRIQIPGQIFSISNQINVDQILSVLKS